MQEINKDLLSLESREDGSEAFKAASEAGTATDSDDSLEAYDLNEDHEEGKPSLWTFLLHAFSP